MKRDEFTPLKTALIKIKCVYRYDNRFILLDSYPTGLISTGLKKCMYNQQNKMCLNLKRIVHIFLTFVFWLNICRFVISHNK